MWLKHLDCSDCSATFITEDILSDNNVQKVLSLFENISCLLKIFRRLKKHAISLNDIVIEIEIVRDQINC